MHKAEEAAAASRRVAEAATKRQTEREAASSARWHSLEFYLGYVVPVLTFYSVMLIAGSRQHEPIEFKWDHVVGFVPILNWVFLLIFLTSPDRALVIKTCMVWVVAGVAMFVISSLRARA